MGINARGSNLGEGASSGERRKSGGRFHFGPSHEQIGQVHRAWLDKDRELLNKEKELQGPAPEVVLEWQWAKRNLLMLRTLRGSTAYHVKIRDIAIKEDRLKAKFEEVGQLVSNSKTNVLK